MNAIGAAATGLRLLIIVASKFREGAWITVLIIPPLIVVFRRVRRYHGPRSTFLKALRGGPRIALITTPWYVHDAKTGKEISPSADVADTADKSVVVSAAE